MNCDEHCRGEAGLPFMEMDYPLDIMTESSRHRCAAWLLKRKEFVRHFNNLLVGRDPTPRRSPVCIA